MVTGVDFERAKRTESSDPVTENIFLTGKAWEFLTHKIFEGEAGNSFLMAAGVVTIAVLCGRERRAAVLARNLQLGPALSMRSFGHPKYRHHIPKNPLLRF